MTPQFPPLDRVPHTLLSEEAKAEGWTDEIGTTILGETINRSEVSGDNLWIFDPQCKPTGDGSYKFLRHLPGELGYAQADDEVAADRVVVADLLFVQSTYNAPVIAELLSSRQPIQFVAAPGTEREQRYRVTREGTIQRIGGAVRTPFRIDLPGGDHSHPRITVEAQGDCVITWADNGIPTGKKTKAIYALLSLPQIQELGDIWYALNALTEESFATYGRIVGSCAMCGRTLDDAASIKRGLGPSCAKRLNDRTAQLIQA